MSNTYDVIVIGGGLVGMSVAYHLVKGGAKTLLLDREDEGRATNAGAGILSPETSTGYSETWFKFAVEAVAYYPDLIAHLNEEQAGDTGYARCGKLTVAVTEDEYDAFEAAKTLIFARQKERGQPDPADLYSLSPEAARELFPPLASVYGAIYYKQAARVDGRLLTKALARAAAATGLEVIKDNVTHLNRSAQKVTGVTTQSNKYEAGMVIIAGGAWSRQFGKKLGVHIPVEPQRGQIIHLTVPETETGQWPIVSAFRGHYIVTWPDARVAVGASRETGSGFNPQPTAGGVQEVLSEALRVAPGLTPAKIREIRVGLRPLTSDYLPVLGAVPEVAGILLCTGHGPTGLQLGPYSGKLIAAMVIGEPFTTDITPFSIARFG